LYSRINSIYFEWSAKEPDPSPEGYGPAGFGPNAGRQLVKGYRNALEKTQGDEFKRYLSPRIDLYLPVMKNYTGVDLKAIAWQAMGKYGFEPAFSKAVIEEVNSLSDRASQDRGPA